MIKKRLKSLAFTISLVGSTLLAQGTEIDSDTFSLVGLEGSYSSLDYENGTRTDNIQGSESLGGLGLKLGAESKDFRIFLGGRYFVDSESKYDYIVTYGAELQYKFNVSQIMNIFVGVNGGIANMKFRADGEDFSRTLQEPYVGGDVGANIHLGRSVDLEIGARILSIEGDNTINSVTYHVGSIVSGYGAIIFKWQMD